MQVRYNILTERILLEKKKKKKQKTFHQPQINKPLASTSTFKGTLERVLIFAELFFKKVLRWQMIL